MAIQMGLRVEIPSIAAFPNNALFLGVQAETDFDKRGQGDDQARDKQTGQRVWTVTAMDLDPDAAKFGRNAQIKVKVLAEHQPVPPASQIPGYPPVIEFEGLQFTPYVDDKKCRAPQDGRQHKCKAQQTYSFRATGIRAASTLPAADDSAA
ncbi:hypothetical protein [Actinocatenispora rupis]|jgi:hypothetical protein|uniref:Plasmid replication, integration and excision activator n=1 Tax=Actinocatenispora rupis TaxID=519421 RepID=A0A8J3J925_9ACTN|nr:hypothetical protein [Actinocatenispora rupis]GID14110.1 hypothetical protein Aru02nite_49990 [Actinocatenispora rupis]